MVRRPVLVLVAAVAATAASSCGSDAALPTEGAYCAQVGNHLTALNSPALALPTDIAAMVKEWKLVADAAPVAIAQEWDTMITALETAVTVNPADNASVQKMADTARSSEPAATRVITYTYEKCGATIGGVVPTPTTSPPATAAPTAAPTSAAP